jgi:hypothetical protein
LWIRTVAVYLSPRFAPLGAFGTGWGVNMRVGVYRSVVVNKDRTHSFEQLLQGFRDDIAMLEDG